MKVKSGRLTAPYRPSSRHKFGRPCVWLLQMMPFPPPAPPPQPYDDRRAQLRTRPKHIDSILSSALCLTFLRFGFSGKSIYSIHLHHFTGKPPENTQANKRKLRATVLKMGTQRREHSLVSHGRNGSHLRCDVQHAAGLMRIPLVALQQRGGGGVFARLEALEVFGDDAVRRHLAILEAGVLRVGLLLHARLQILVAQVHRQRRRRRGPSFCRRVAAGLAGLLRFRLLPGLRRRGIGVRLPFASGRVPAATLARSAAGLRQAGRCRILLQFRPIGKSV